MKQEVRKAPRDARLRTFLFQLFCIFGEWDRALNQLTVASELDPGAIPMAQTYRALIRCEILRGKIFAGTRTPTIFGNPEPWMSLLIEAIRGTASGAMAEAARLRDEAFEQAPTSTGTIGEERFEWVADADPRLGPMLEGIVEGRYVWIPFHRIAQILVEEPTDLRDQVWMPVEFTWANGGQAVGFVPTRYPGSSDAQDVSLALATRTEWQDQGHDWFFGFGQRMLATDNGEVPLMDLRRLRIDAAAPDAEGTVAADPQPPHQSEDAIS